MKHRSYSTATPKPRAKSIGTWASTAHSHDHKLLAYSTDDKGSELYTIRIRDLATGLDLADEIPETRGGLEWARDGKTALLRQSR